MNTGALRIAGAALLVVLGIWAGAKLHLSRGPAESHHGVPVPAGEASAPNPSDLAQASEGAAPGDPLLSGTPPGTPPGALPGTLPGTFPGALPIRKIPERLPQFSLADRAGKATSITSFGAKSLIINFWATWCAPCRSEIPLLETLHAEWAGREVSVVGIAVDYRDKVLEFADRLKIGYPLLIGEQDALDAAAAFGVESPVFPFTVFTDRRGEVVAVFVGELHRLQAEIILAQVQNLNKDLIQLPAARRAIAASLDALKVKNAG
jgi:thiol-disulfide isomerase/thioredoxin